MKHALILILILLVAGCSKQEQNSEEQSGSATTTVSSDVIDSDMGYIVENARLVDDAANAEVSIKGMLKLATGPGDVLIIRTQSENGQFTELLALAFPGFAEGTRAEYTALEGEAGFWVFGITGKTEVMKATGVIEGSIRLVKKEAAENSLGLSRDMQNGVGEIEIVVSQIDNEGIPVQAEKKYAARFRLPLISLDELARINQPI
jgi:hypothetical protein